ncbi:MAG: TIGR02757 family protein [Chitinophagaceae bacterium]|nr:TIGR02757 family protein [Chitinophagaceae bacterium]
MQASLIDFFNKKVAEYNQLSFIPNDPVCIPHLFSQKPDIEISAFFAAIFAWGNRTTIINKSKELMQWMDMQPYQFCLHAGKTDLQKLLSFKHRTFNATDLLYCITFFRHHYTYHNSLEQAFLPGGKKPDTIYDALVQFHQYFFSLPDAPARTHKHIANPAKGSTCKRLNMFLRWMVRHDKSGVDLGIWKKIKPGQLICPIDVHVARVAKRFGLLERKQIDWQAAEELTTYLRKLDAHDPVKYDFALFGLGVMEKY